MDKYPSSRSRRVLHTVAVLGQWFLTGFDVENRATRRIHRRYRFLSAFLIWAMVFPLFTPLMSKAAWATPVPPRSAQPIHNPQRNQPVESLNPLVQQQLDRSLRSTRPSLNLPEGGRMDGLLPGRAPASERVSQVDPEVTQSPESSPTPSDEATPEAEKKERTKFPVWGYKEVVPEWGPGLPPKEDKPSPSSSKKKNTGSADDDSIKVGRHSEDKDEHKERHHQAACNAVESPLAALRVVLPGESNPPSEFSRQFQPEGPFLTMTQDAASVPQAFNSDHMAYFSRAFKIEDGAASKEILYHFKSSIAQNNVTALQTAASCRYRYTRTAGNKASGLSSASVLEITVWDIRHPNGETVLLKNYESHLCKLDCSVGVAARDLGVWGWTIVNDGVETNKTFKVGEPIPSSQPGFARITRSSVTKDITQKNFVAYTQDRVIYTQKYDLPEATTEHPDVQRTIHWKWTGHRGHGESRGNCKNSLGSYMDVVTTYHGTLDKGYTVVTKVYDPAYPAGRTLSSIVGEEHLHSMSLSYGEGLPSGTYQFTDSVDGHRCRSNQIQVREVKYAITTPTGAIQPENGPTRFLMKLDCLGPGAPSNFNWTLRVLNGNTGKPLKVYNGEVRDNHQRHFTLSQYWDNTDALDQQVGLNFPVYTELEFDFDPAVSRLAASMSTRSLAISGAVPAAPFSEVIYLGVTESRGTTADVGDILAGYTLTVPEGVYTVSLGMRAGYLHCAGVSYKIFIDGKPAAAVQTGVLLAGEASSLTAVSITPGVHDLTIQAQIHPPGPPEGCYRNPWFGTWAGFLTVQYEPGPPPSQPPPDEQTEKDSKETTTTTCRVMKETVAPVTVERDYSSPVVVHINPTSGLTSHAFNDLAIPTRGQPLVISRYHLSEREAQVPRLGWNWSFHDLLYLDLEAGRIIHSSPDGGAHAYTKDGEEWVAACNCDTNKLVQLDDRHYELRTKDKMRYCFEVPAKVSPTSVEAFAVLSQEIDRNDNTNHFHWDPTGQRLLKIEGPVPQQFLRLDWDSRANQPRRVTDHTGRHVDYSYERVAGTNYWVLSKITQPGGTQYSHGYQTNAASHEAHLLKTSLNGVLQEKLVNCGPPGQLEEVTHRPDKTQTFERITALDGSVTTKMQAMAPNVQTRTATFTIDSENNATGMVEAVGDTLQRTASGKVVNEDVTERIDALGHKNKMSYDARHNLESVTNNLEKTTTLKWNDQDQLILITDAEQKSIKLDYDSHSNLKKITDQLQHETIFDYNGFGKPIRVTDHLGHSWTFNYDALGFLRGRTAPVVSPLEPAAHWTYEVDTLGRRTGVKDPLGRVTTFVFDDRNRCVKTISPAVRASVRQTALPPAVTIANFDANDLLRSTVAADGLITTYSYDLAHRLESVQEPGKSLPTRLVYDGLDNLVRMDNSRGQTTRYDFDIFKRLKRVTYPGNDSESYDYDANDNLIGWDRGTYKVGYEYDELDRLKVIDSPTTGDHVVLGYDNIDRVQSMTDNSGITTYGYTDNNLLQSVTRPGNKVLTHVYDPADRLESTRDPEGLTTLYGYTNRNEISSVTHDGKTVSFIHDPLGRTTKTHLPNGVEVRMAYSERNQLLFKEYKKGNSPLITQKYAFNQLGQRILGEQIDATGSTLRKYQYNDRRQLKLSTKDGPHNQHSQSRYQLDDNDNITNNNGTTFQVNDADQLTIAGAAALSYNGAGQATGVGPQTLTFAYNDQIKSITGAGLNAQYLYDGAGQRVRKTVNGVVQNFLWNGSNIAKEYKADGSVRADYQLGAGAKIDGKWQFYLSDIQGSTLGVADDTGKVIATWDYSDFGETTQTSGDSGLYQPFLYTGQELDAETGYYHNRARHYAPNLAKFLARDTLSNSNRYQYCNGDCINYRDSTGLLPDDTSIYVQGNDAGSHWNQAEKQGTANGRLAGGLALAVMIAPELAPMSVRVGVGTVLIDHPVATALGIGLIEGTAGVPAGSPNLGGFPSSTMTVTQNLAKVTMNRMAGKAFESRLFSILQRLYPACEGFTVKMGGKGSGFWTPMGRRFPDITVSYGKQVLFYIEAKVGNSAYTGLQEAKDLYKLAMTGAPTYVLRLKQ